MPAATAFRSPSARLRRPASSASGQSYAGRALEIGVLLLSMLAALYASSRWVHPAWSLVALANYGWLCALVFRLEPRGAVLFLPQMFNGASCLVALIMIESGGEMFELGLVGRAGPWSSALVLSDLMLCIGFLLTFRTLIRALDRRGEYALSPLLDRYANALAMIALALTAVIALALVVRGLQYGFPLLAGIDRFSFRRFAADKVTLYALNLKFVIGYALGFVAFALPARPWLRKAAIGTFAGMMALYFLFGDKFFTQLGFLSAFGSPYLYRHYAKVGRRIWLYAIIAAIALSGVMTMTTYIYSKGFTETRAATVKRLSGRMVGQGELWFLQSSIGAPLIDWNATLIERYAQSFTVKATDLFAAQNSLGAHYFSNRYAPDYLRSSLHRNAGSVTYTEVAEPMGLVLFGWLGLGLMMAIVGMLVGLACSYMAYAIENRSLLSALFAAYVLNQLQASIVQAAPWVIGSIYSLRWLVVILIIELGLLLLGQGGARSRPRHRRDRRLPPRAIQQAAERAIERPLDQHVHR
ncbi:hypothetical protein HNO88_000717 [Novosphingobium chloroacetimidivorans]|uniref:DUF6418 domain-containing protein n=1 Tax=Novosphingobium chloroacetimidivorans TaxID=1428314 RepID=A0A7W7K712_9SPHN|nr:DUF6418 domain-containing protein [Novosphingobium chloroacetimidivorans]MBB4857410.1 hypothetical protein [Novosphingobium chloroacetimidivorans]